MALCRILLAVLIAVAVATAPVGFALAATQTPSKIAVTVAKAAMDDCHGKAAKDCPDCNRKAKCPGDGSKCCKLTGTIAALPEVLALAITTQKSPEPQSIPDRSLRPRTPPPRS